MDKRTERDLETADIEELEAAGQILGRPKHTPTPLEIQIDTLNRYLPWDAPELAGIKRAANCHEKYEQKMQMASAQLRNIAVSLGDKHDLFSFVHAIADDLYNATITKAGGL